MKTLYEASNAAEAHMLVDYLRQQGIAAQIRGEHLQGAAGALPALGLVHLVVDEPDYPQARAAIEAWEAAEGDRTSHTPRPDPRYGVLKGLLVGIVLGAGGLYGVLRTPASADGVDYNRDGLLDETWTYSLAGRPLQVEIDRNLDRKVDYVARYDARGLLAKVDTDDDFDGTFETHTTARDGNAEMAESDTDGDGVIDLRTRFDHGVPATVEFLKPSTGLPLRVEHYRLGKLTHADIDVDEDGTLDTRLAYSTRGEVVSRQPVAPEVAK